LKQLIQIQEKVCLSFGRKRKTVAMGIYDFDKIEAPLKYKAVKPESVKFVPLEFKIEMDLNEILQEHPKGREYAHLLEGHKKYPLVIDNKNNVLSMPPVINSQYSGKVTEKTKSLFVEVTGLDIEDCKVALNVLVAAIADRGAKIKSVELDYGEEKIVTPDFSPKKIKVKFDAIENLTGMKLTIREMKDLLEKYNYNVKKAKDALEVEYPSYRQDILHPVDVIEDILIMLGYNSIEPEIPEIATIGSIDELELFCEDVRNLLVGFGANELLNFTMTNRDIQFTKMNLEDGEIVEIANPVSSKWSCLRTWLLPSLMEFFKRNVSYEYPQQIYEVGDYVELDATKETGTFSGKKLAWALADKDANFTKAKQIMVFVLKAIGLDYTFVEEDFGQFIPGRSARVKVGDQFVGFVGEVHPVVLENFGVDFPICSFELNISKLFELKK
jgi:phenylalanyl-tRNA synthetase beta chain